MSILERLASRRPVGERAGKINRAVAQECLARPGLFTEIGEGLRNRDKLVQADCAEVFAEAAEMSPEAVVPYLPALLGQLGTNNNRTLWQALAAIWFVSPLAAREILPFAQRLTELAQIGSVIVKDGAIGTLGNAAALPEAPSSLRSGLLDILSSCIPRDIPRYAEYLIPAARANPAFAADFTQVLQNRLGEIKNKSAESRVRALLRSLAVDPRS